MPHICGSITPCTKAHVTAASTALPPRRMTSRPISAACGCGQTMIATEVTYSPSPSLRPAPPYKWGGLMSSGGELDGESAAGARRRLDPDRPTVPLDDAPGDSEPQAAARVAALKALE